MAVLIPDEKVNCFDFLAKKIFKAKRDNFHPGHLADEGSPFEYIHIRNTLVDCTRDAI